MEYLPERGGTRSGLPDLIELKRQAGRAQDLEDVRALEAIAREIQGGGDE